MNLPVMAAAEKPKVYGAHPGYVENVSVEYDELVEEVYPEVNLFVLFLSSAIVASVGCVFYGCVFTKGKVRSGNPCRAS